MPMPDFFTSEWFVCETDKWHLKPGAPEHIQRDFNEWMQTRKDAENNGVILD